MWGDEKCLISVSSSVHSLRSARTLNRTLWFIRRLLCDAEVSSWADLSSLLLGESDVSLKTSVSAVKPREEDTLEHKCYSDSGSCTECQTHCSLFSFFLSGKPRLMNDILHCSLFLALFSCFMLPPLVSRCLKCSFSLMASPAFFLHLVCPCVFALAYTKKTGPAFMRL